MVRLACKTMQNHLFGFRSIKNDIFDIPKEEILYRIKYDPNLIDKPMQQKLVRENVLFIRDQFNDWHNKTGILPVVYEITVLPHKILITRGMGMVKRTMIAVDVFFRIMRSICYQCHRNAFNNASRPWLPRFSCAVEQLTRTGEVAIPHVHGIIMFHPDWQEIVEARLIPNELTIANRLEDGVPIKKPLTLTPDLIISPGIRFDKKIGTVNFDEITDVDGIIEWTKYYTKGAEKSRVNQDKYISENLKNGSTTRRGFMVTGAFLRETGIGEHFTPFRSPLTYKNIKPQFMDYKRKQKHNHRYTRLLKRVNR